MLARWCAPRPTREGEDPAPPPSLEAIGRFRDHVIICGYRRIGQNVAHFLEKEHILYVALDLDPAKVKAAHAAGARVFYGDAAERDILEAVGLKTARLVVISHEDVSSALKVLHHLRAVRADLPVMVRTRDESRVRELRTAGAAEVVPETLEASLMIAAHALLLLDVPISRVVRRVREQREGRYRLLREFFRSDPRSAERLSERDAHRLWSVVLPADSPVVGRPLEEIDLAGVVVTALVRRGERRLTPRSETRLEVGDVVVLFGAPDDLRRAERVLLG